MERFIRTLDEVGAGSLNLVGGKGANLGELVAAGAPVPAAFCVTTDAYRLFVDQNGLRGEIARILDGVDYGDPAGIEISASKIRSLIVGAPVPPGIVSEIVEAYAALEAQLGKDVAVSVRSSATAEDLPGTSFAGQQDTYLFMSGRTAVLDAVRRCWASLWTDRAIAYRHRQGFEHESVLLAVVVQEMFPSEVSGVMFTANPVTSNPFEFFLNVSWGLGEAVVSGQVNPDQFIVDKKTLAPIDRKINDKVVMTARDPSGQGSTTVPVPEDRRRAPSLDDEAIRQLCELGQRIEDHYGFYQDIEWGFAGGQFAILQAREITGADLDFGHEIERWKTPKALEDVYDERWTYSRGYSDEVQTGPSTPSFYSTLQMGMTYLYARALSLMGTKQFLDYDEAHFLDFPQFRWYGARAYYNLAYLREKIRMWIPPFARTDAQLWPFPKDQHEEIRNLPFEWDPWFSALRALEENEPTHSLLGTTRAMYAGGWERTAVQNLAFWDSFDTDSATLEEILLARPAPVDADPASAGQVILPFTVFLFVLQPGLEVLCRAWFDDAEGRIYSQLVAGLKTKTSEENIALWQLSSGIAASAELSELVKTTPDEDILDALSAREDARPFLADFETFIADFGHRGGAERDAFHPRWRDKPSLVFLSLRLMLGMPSPEQHEARLRQQMLETKANCIATLRAQPDDLGEFEWLRGLNDLTQNPVSTRAELFEWYVELVQDFCYYRDFERFHNDRNMGPVSRIKHEAIGKKMVEQALIETVEDVYFLSVQEHVAAANGDLTVRQIANRVRARRRTYEKYSHLEPPKFIRGWEVFDDDAIDAEGALVGIGASSGVITGTARVCRNLAEIGKIRPGDILVTVATDPGWTTVFSIIGGVVVESGGVVAHAVMISREYGLPCVANLSRCCDQIPDGATITVDGTRGRVLVHDNAAPTS